MTSMPAPTPRLRIRASRWSARKKLIMPLLVPVHQFGVSLGNDQRNELDGILLIGGLSVKQIQGGPHGRLQRCGDPDPPAPRYGQICHGIINANHRHADRSSGPLGDVANGGTGRQYTFGPASSAYRA